MENLRISKTLNQFGNKISIIFIFFLFLSFTSCSKDQDIITTVIEPSVIKASSVIDSMGTGFNLGNTFDLASHSTTPETIYKIIDFYYNAGMRHIRIPVTWMEGFGGNTIANANGQINFQHARFIQLKTVIDYAIAKKMYVVLNAHHENWLSNYDGSENYNAKFRNLWRGIAEHFKNYPQFLIFELLNEPHGKFGDWSGGADPFSNQALTLTRQIYDVGYNVVRETGGANVTRIIMVSTNGMGNHSLIEEVYPNKTYLPGGGTDDYLAIQVHTYDPWSFCGQNGSNSFYPGSSSIENSIRNVATHARLLDVPVNYGEFGVGRESNTNERNTDIVREFYRTIRMTTLDENMSSTVWDDRGWFGLIISNGQGSYIFMYNIVPTMMAP